MYIVCVLLWPFLALSGSYFVLMPVLAVVHLLTGISVAGVNLCTGNIALKAAPHGKATAFLAVNTIVHGIAAAAAPILGGIIADRLTAERLPLMPHWSLTDKGSFLSLLSSGLLGLPVLFFITALLAL